ncbi:MAG: GNAT family N-acetyltransferase [Oscillatoriales cyanobacterium]|nr:MAG: GNAT family N-acetyltransferase [Oscillatoriales cyanobacterium]
MIRPIAPDDTPALIALVEAIGFEPHETEELAHDDGLVGVAYVAPERMTEGTWNLYLIAVHPDRQRQGRGAALLAHVEQMLAQRGERVLLVETSGLESFEYVRSFYRKSGYDEEARIREFYKAGEDKIVFRKALTALG